VHGTSELPASFVALMVCTCRRWDRVTSRLIAAVEDSALLGDAELDELADSFLSYKHVISYPLAWVSPQWLDVELDGGNGRTYTVDDDTLAQHRPLLEPPLRRWAARRALARRGTSPWSWRRVRALGEGRSGQLLPLPGLARPRTPSSPGPVQVVVPTSQLRRSNRQSGVPDWAERPSLACSRIAVRSAFAAGVRWRWARQARKIS